MRGDGTVYKRGHRWWLVYHINGKRYREPCSKDVTTKTDAKAALKKIHGDIRQGTYLTPVQRHVTVDDLLDDLVVHLQNKGCASVKSVSSHLKAVRGVLGRARAVDLSTAAIERYQRKRLDAGRKPATVNRECEALRQALRRAARVTPPRIPAAPHVPLLKVQNARQGFLSRAEFEALLRQIPDVDLRDYLEWAGWTGMRPGEIRQLTWEMLDRETWTLSLDPRADKTRRGRVLAVSGPLRTIIERRTKARRLDCPLIFHRVSRGRHGQPVRDFRKVWAKALKDAGLAPGLLPYDLRRTAIRNLVRAGVDPTIAMRISGHRTNSTFRRYNIVDEKDLEQAVQKVSAYVATLPTERNVIAIEPMAETPQKRHTRGSAGIGH